MKSRLHQRTLTAMIGLLMLFLSALSQQPAGPTTKAEIIEPNIQAEKNVKDETIVNGYLVNCLEEYNKLSQSAFGLPLNAILENIAFKEPLYGQLSWDGFLIATNFIGRLSKTQTLYAKDSLLSDSYSFLDLQPEVSAVGDNSTGLQVGDRLVLLLSSEAIAKEIYKLNSGNADDLRRFRKALENVDADEVRAACHKIFGPQQASAIYDEILLKMIDLADNYIEGLFLAIHRKVYSHSKTGGINTLVFDGLDKLGVELTKRSIGKESDFQTALEQVFGKYRHIGQIFKTNTFGAVVRRSGVYTNIAMKIDQFDRVDFLPIQFHENLSRENYQQKYLLSQQDQAMCVRVFAGLQGNFRDGFIKRTFINHPDLISYDDSVRYYYFGNKISRGRSFRPEYLTNPLGVKSTELLRFYNLLLKNSTGSADSILASLNTPSLDFKIFIALKYGFGLTNLNDFKTFESSPRKMVGNGVNGSLLCTEYSENKNVKFVMLSLNGRPDDYVSENNPLSLKEIQALSLEDTSGTALKTELATSKIALWNLIFEKYNSGRAISVLGGKTFGANLDLPNKTNISYIIGWPIGTSKRGSITLFGANYCAQIMQDGNCCVIGTTSWMLENLIRMTNQDNESREEFSHQSQLLMQEYLKEKMSDEMIRRKLLRKLIFSQ